MKVTVYRQASKQREDGTIVYKGEDTLPYVDDQMFFVADGLGGAASIRHAHINPDLFDKNKIVETLFKGVYTEYKDERFAKYVADSFYELFAVKDCYTDNVNNIKKSGYFASRIVSAIFMYIVFFNDTITPEMLTKLYHAQTSESKKQAFLKTISDRFADQVREDLRKVAKNANLTYETTYAGLALLGSTLCATIYLENEDSVDAFYFTAGDSRPYVWTEKEGLGQLLEDQEGKDGGMTNYIKANDGETFEIRCNYFSFMKPCILFNASDGCFDSGYFLSQMAFEKLILESAVSAKDEDEMGQILYDTFLEYGRHDDSSTIAMKIFGYDNFTQFQESAKRRLQQIRDQYLERMPDLLEGDFIKDYADASASFPGLMSEIKAKVEAAFPVIEYCKERVKAEGDSSYISKVKSVDEQIVEANAHLLKKCDTVRNLIRDNYSKFYELETNKINWQNRHTVSHIQDLKSKQQRKSADYISALNEYKTDFETTVEHLQTVLGNIFDIGVPSDFSDYDSLDFSMIDECEKRMESLFDFFEDIRKKKQDTVKRLTQLKEEYVEQNRKLAMKNESLFSAFCDRFISGAVDIDNMRGILSEKEYEQLKQLLESIAEIRKSIRLLQTEEKEKVLSECAGKYWQDNYVAVITELVDGRSPDLPPVLKKEAETVLETIHKQTDEVKSKADLQGELFKTYEILYLRYLGGIAE